MEKKTWHFAADVAFVVALAVVPLSGCVALVDTGAKADGTAALWSSANACKSTTEGSGFAPLSLLLEIKQNELEPK